MRCPNSEYMPYVEALLSSQNSWAFDRHADPVERIGQVVALDSSDGALCFVFGSVVDQEVADYATFARQMAAAGG